MTERASKTIARKLRHLGFTPVAEPESFLADKEPTRKTTLEAGEEDRAERWGRTLVTSG